MSKFREFWINEKYYTLAYSKDFIVKNDETRTFSGIHVIEYSAYQALLKQASQLEQALEFYENTTRLMLTQRNIPGSEIEGSYEAMIKSRSIQDDGDTARQSPNSIPRLNRRTNNGNNKNINI